ncbi:MAG TPA: alpha-hydroxy-acid oxidizing protein, partial [Actinomycetota bacterium]|nr:alpha-hydroxy-acid oxidizing protein [Actinomycetota bacterium]
HPTATWEELRRLREQTTLPLLLKGIQHPDDARQAVDSGADGLMVSNHGGRQVDGAVASLDALPDVVAAADGRVPVLFDSGIRTGADAVKALALGATAVLLGRPYVWGLALGGETGVHHVLRSFLAELELTMALAGLRSLDEIGPEILRPDGQTGS